MSERPPRRSFEQTITTVGRRVAPFTDVYAFLLRSRWTVVVALAAAAFLTLNLVFAWLYTLVPGSIANSDGSFSDAFFFSVQTFGAIGYGFMYSQGVFANVVVVVEAFCSLLCIAVVTGLVFAKFARPHARVLFSDVCVIERRNGVPTLTFRVANERSNDVVEAAVRVSALMTTKTTEGRTLRRFHDLDLERERTPLFRLTWQVFHPITEQSPIHGLSEEELLADDVRLIVSLTGLDGTFAQTIHAQHMYWADEIQTGRHFVDVLETLPGGKLRMDYRKFHETQAE